MASHTSYLFLPASLTPSHQMRPLNHKDAELEPAWKSVDFLGSDWSHCFVSWSGGGSHLW